MTGWRHVDGDPCEGVAAPGYTQQLRQCGCTTPTPDPASPCGYEGCWLTGIMCHCGDPSEGCPGDHAENADGGHRFVPTRCTCGHPIEAVP